MSTRTATFADVRRFGTRPALLSTEGSLSYRGIADRIDASVEHLTTEQRLVMIAGANTVESVIAYTAAMALGHTVLLAPPHAPDQWQALTQTYDPDVVFGPGTGGDFVQRREGSRHELHPELSLLLATSGSTGSPKMVRLSHANVTSNAASIADYLQIDRDDRALTTLPMHYCYGLSVINSHLLSGAGLVMTDLSVVDECLWRLCDETQATSFAGVPYTFDLLDSSGFAEREVPSLRYVTQAGGRLAPERIAAYARLGAERGWDFYAMYGQTEATARMAYLPPRMALDRPHLLGVPVPGGALRIDPVPESAGAGEGVGELVYSGPNVMMGYASDPADLARGAELDELRTGDLAREHPDGTFEWVGRRNRLAKVFGIRIDLDDLERRLGPADARCVAVGDGVRGFIPWHGDVPAVHRQIADICGLPLHAIEVERLRAVPRTPAGKTDYRALERYARESSASGLPRSRGRRERPVSAREVRDVFAHLLGRPDATLDDTFVSLGGDSLSYVEVSVRLGECGLAIPADWSRRSIRELAGGPALGSRGTRLETSILMRGIAIVLILGSHSNLWTVLGGAHLLLAVAGYNFARFQVMGRRRTERFRTGLAAVANIAVPSMLWIGAVAVFVGMYRPETVLLLNGLLGSDRWDVQWQFWFLEAIVWSQLAAVGLLAVPWIHQAQRRAPFGFAMVIVVATVAVRYAAIGVEAGPTERYTIGLVLWCLAIGWAAAVASAPWQRLVVSLVILVAVPGFFGDVTREAIVAGGMLLLVWTDMVPVPRWCARVLGVLATASLYIYVTQWQVYPHLEDHVPLLAVLASLAVGIAYQRGWDRLRRRVVALTEPR